MTVSLAVGDLWDPYIQVPGASRLDTTELASSTVRALLSHRAVRQARSVVDAVDRGDLDRLPLVLRSLDEETGGQLTRRIANMMAALYRFLTASEHADVREKLATAFRPMGAWVRGQFVVTSPVVLVVQSILYSHCEWFRPHLFEAYSAARAHEELWARGIPEAHRRFIAALIAQQTLLRGAWRTDPETDAREVFAFYEAGSPGARRIVWAHKEFKDDDERAGPWADEAVGRAIAHTLYPFIAPGPVAAGDSRSEVLPALERQLAAALVLHTLCLACRNHREERPGLGKTKQQALRFLDYLLDAHTPWKYEPALAFLQYGRVVRQANSELLDTAMDWIAGSDFDRGARPAGAVDKLENVSLCFQRVSTKRVWEGRVFDPGRAKREPGDGEWRPGPGDSEVQALIGATVGAVRVYGLDAADYIRVALGIAANGRGRRS